MTLSRAERAVLIAQYAAGPARLRGALGVTFVALAGPLANLA